MSDSEIIITQLKYWGLVDEKEKLRSALADLMEQLDGVGIAHKECDEGQWRGTEGLSFVQARRALGEIPICGKCGEPVDQGCGS